MLSLEDSRHTVSTKFTDVARNVCMCIVPMTWLGDRITFGFGVINQGVQWTKPQVGVKRA